MRTRMSRLSQRSPARFALLAFAAALLSGCVNRPASDLPPVDVSAIKTLGVYSACGRTITREAYAAFRVGLDDITQGDISEWRLDGVIVDAVRAKAPAAMRVVDVDVDPAVLPMLTDLRVQKDRSNEIRAAIRGDIAQADAYMIIVPQTTQTIYTTAYGRMPGEVRVGVGLYSRMNDKTAHVTCRSHVYDPQRNLVVRNHGTFKFAPLPDDLRLDTWAEYSESARRRARELLSPLAAQAGDDLMTKFIDDPRNLAPAAAK